MNHICSKHEDEYLFERHKLGTFYVVNGFGLKAWSHNAHEHAEDDGDTQKHHVFPFILKVIEKALQSAFSILGLLQRGAQIASHAATSQRRLRCV